jgi:hypothetical protein
MSTYNQQSAEWSTYNQYVLSRLSENFRAVTSGSTGDIYILRYDSRENVWETAKPTAFGVDIIARAVTLESATIEAMRADKATERARKSLVTSD